MASSNIDSQRGGQNRPEGGSSQFNTGAGTVDASIVVNDKHQPGKLVGNDNIETFSAQTLPAGTAPPSRTFEPNPTGEAPPVPESETTNASDTLPGATSADVHTGLGHPGGGQSSAELRSGTSKGTGLEGRLSGAGQGTIDPHDPGFANQRALDNDNATAGRSDVPSAEERLPETATRVAAEHPNVQSGGGKSQ